MIQISNQTYQQLYSVNRINDSLNTNKQNDDNVRLRNQCEVKHFLSVNRNKKVDKFEG